MLIEAPFSTRLRSWLFHPDRLAIFGLLGLLFAFLSDLFLVKAAPLTGDHLEQHYPWAFQLAQSLKEFKLPFWTPLIQCGFPLVAESQVGAFLYSQPSDVFLPSVSCRLFLHESYSLVHRGVGNVCLCQADEVRPLRRLLLRP